MSATNVSDSMKAKQGSPTNSEMADSNTCVVCFKNLEIYSIGECDHPVCYECSTRMRVLCQQNECPICRKVLGKVIFTYDKLPYRELEAKNRSEYYNKRYKIHFYTYDIQKRFFELLDHPCPKCDAKPYRSIQGLRDHVQRQHKLLYCDLCVDHLKIFTFERSCYTQEELMVHLSKGDKDNTSHRGHPLCKPCNKRFLDNDELYRHSRREHFFCHLCDEDDEDRNAFYKEYKDLENHFRKKHWLCEQGKCATEQFIGAFRTEIDLKAHIASVHGKNMNKQQAKQTRTLQMEITLGPRGRSAQSEQHVASMRTRGHENYEDDEQDPTSLYAQNQYQGPITIDSQNEQDFPSLGGGASAPVQPLMPFPMRRGLPGGLARTKENFPALGGGSGGAAASKAPQTNAPQMSLMLKNSAPSKNSTQASQNNSSSQNGSGMILHVSNRPSGSNGGAIAKKSVTPSMDFPALPSSSSSISGASKAFSHLSLNGKSKKMKAQPIPQQPHQQQQKSSRQQLLEEDMLPATTNANLTVGMVAAKHRTLVDDYVSVANPKNFQKIQMVQKEKDAAKQAAAVERTKAPKLTADAFPTLGECSSSANGPTSNWSKQPTNVERKQRELENRKAKIAPAPLLKSEQQQQQHPQQNNKRSSKENQAMKEKKPKEKKNETTNNSKNQQNTTKTQPKLKEKNNNNENKQNSNEALKFPTVNAPSDGGDTKTNDDNSTIAHQLRPPPGFLNSKGPASAEADSQFPPPGFISNVTVNSVAKSRNNLTFISSLGENYSILPKQSYTQPPDSTRRNQKLVEDFQSAMDGIECFKEFHLISQKLREGLYKPEAFYEHCQIALKDKFDVLFPELLALLPDIGKQQSLYLIHAQRLNSMPAEERKCLPQLMVCSACGQVVLTSDTENHETSHQFPSLNGGMGKATTSAKKK